MAPPMFEPQTKRGASLGGAVLSFLPAFLWTSKEKLGRAEHKRNIHFVSFIASGGGLPLSGHNCLPLSSKT